MRRLKFKSKKAFLSLTIFTFSFVLNGNINIADGNDLKKYLWKNRVILFFSKDKNNILYKEQKKEFSNIKQETEKRDLIFIEISENINSKHKALSKKYNPKSFNFKISLIGKDGRTKLESLSVVSHETIFSLIDSMPMRQMKMSK